MIKRLVPKYPVFLIVGLVIVAAGLFLMAMARDILNRGVGQKDVRR